MPESPSWLRNGLRALQGASPSKPPVVLYGACALVLVILGIGALTGSGVALFLAAMSLIPFAIAIEFVRNGFTRLVNPETMRGLPEADRRKTPLSFWLDVGLFVAAGLFFLWMAALTWTPGI